MPSPAIHWLDDSAPALVSAARWLIDDAVGADGACDLGSTVCVLPGPRAGRQLVVELVRRCADRGAPLVPPRTINLGRLAGALVTLPGAVATPFEVALAWIEALRDLDEAQRAPLLPRPPETDDLLAWHGLARELARLQRELAGARLSPSRVADEAAALDLPGESERWAAIAAAHASYRRVLDDLGLVDEHDAMETALHAGRGPAGTHAVLIGLADLSPLQRAVFESHPGRVSALVHGDESRRDRFDDLGCVITERWAEVDLKLADDDLTVADRPEDQAQAVIEAIGSFDGRYRADEVVVGLGEPEFGETIARAGAWADVSFHDPAGMPLHRTAPWRLLDAAAAYIDDPRVQTLAPLLRHPDLGIVDDALIATLDRWSMTNLPDQLDGDWIGDPGMTAPLRAARDRLDEILAPLRRGPAPLAEHAAGAIAVLGVVYGGLDPEATDPATRRIVDACLALRDALDDIRLGHERLQPTTDGPAALGLVLTAVAGGEVPAAAATGQAEMLRWPELHLDTAPALILTGVNDGRIPEAAAGDPFLPDSLRRTLGLMHNERRYARDAYLLDAIRRSRRHLAIIAGRRSLGDEPLTPSRLLLACLRARLASRIDRLSGERHLRSWRRPLGAPTAGAESRFDVPELPPLPALKRMRVTQFKAYLACPYRFALTHLLELARVEEGPREMNAMQFGRVLHDVMEDFAADGDINGSTDRDRIASFLHAALTRRVAARLGPAPPPAVRIQAARLRQRLDAMAAVQADLRRAGWRIHTAEWSLPEGAALDVDGDPMPITGRIDRIDRHDDTGALRIIDYKTSENADTPQTAHQGVKRYAPDRWIDVQLPLYRHLAAEHGFDGDACVGYITLPRSPDGVALRLADWTAAQIEEGVETARQVIRDIRDGKFERNPGVSERFDDYARLCQTTAFVSDATGEDDEP